jgi:hypothetical protein
MHAAEVEKGHVEIHCGVASPMPLDKRLPLQEGRSGLPLKCDV